MSRSQSNSKTTNPISFEEFKAEVLADYLLAWQSRHASTVGRKEVLTGKAKFGIFGAGKELAQIALCKFFNNGDFRSGYYRDQTMALATGNATLQTLFAQLYAHPSIEKDPNSGGRMMNAHFATRLLDDEGNWKNQLESKNFAADLSPTAAQMLKAVGLALSSKVYRNVKNIENVDMFSNEGNEICYATIGDASTSEGIFWEAVNASCVMQIPIIFNVWDDGYGISVPKKYQTAKSSISEALMGMKAGDDDTNGMDIYVVKGWDYAELVKTYKIASEKTRETHRPALVHVIEVTQPQGHSTSGSHERYKDEKRLQFEKDFDCITKFQEWILENKIANEEELKEIEKKALNDVNEAKKEAFESYQNEIVHLKEEAKTFINFVSNASKSKSEIDLIVKQLDSNPSLFRKDILKAVHQILQITEKEAIDSKENLFAWYQDILNIAKEQFNSHLYSQSKHSTENVQHIAPEFGEEEKPGHEIINMYFDHTFNKRSNVVAFGEDVGQIGDVNQGMAGLQEKFGVERIFDTGIREATIIGQGQGLAMRGLRPIAEIQYLDYLLYGIVPLSDDIATLQYRTKGGQKAPLIVRTRGHRLEGIWHSGSPMGMMLHALRGIHICVPRNLTQAAGMYETLLNSDEPAVVVEPLNGYRLKEKCPTNIGSYTIPLGQIEVLNQGNDITMVSYGSTLRICQDAIEKLNERGISVELIDIQTLYPFDIAQDIVKSIQKTNRLLIVDEDVSGGASAYILSKILEEQDAYRFLDSKPETLAAQDHRPAYGTDGDYFSKPNAENIYDAVYEIIKEAKPNF
jgi:pyruvate/2-oxoglutarate/acetoin dehydrogenase E1 component/TPP-dependent pyruvate/acetoin dehydrogenase alpha subunit